MTPPAPTASAQQQASAKASTIPPAARPSTPRVIPPPKLVLPTEKQKPTLTFDTAMTYVYGPEGIGKTTFGNGINPDGTVTLGCEPGQGAIEAYIMPVGSWPAFREIGALLAEDAALGDNRRFKHYLVDTVDELQRMCQDHICTELGIKHPSDLEYGKGWAAVGDEFKLRVGRLCSLGAGVTFISHAKDEEVKGKVGTYTKSVPTLPGAAQKWLSGFVDYVFYATFLADDDGVEQRVIRTQPSANWSAKQRIPAHLPPLPDPLPLDAGEVRAAMDAVFGAEQAAA